LLQPLFVRSRTKEFEFEIWRLIWEDGKKFESWRLIWKDSFMSVRLAYQLPASNTFFSKQISQQYYTFFSEQISQQYFFSNTFFSKQIS
jgi:hypothetical protein